MDKSNSRYAKHLVISAALAACVHKLIRFTGCSPSDSAVWTALMMLLPLGLLTGLAVTSAAHEEPAHVTASRMLTMASAATAAFLGASYASGHVAFIAAAFFVGIPYAIFALRKDVDNHITPAYLLFSTVTQGAVVLWIVR